MTASDLSPDPRRDGAAAGAEQRLDLTLEVADCQDLHYARRVLRRRLVVGRRHLRARPRARGERARPRLPAGRPHRPHRMAADSGVGADVRSDGAVHARSAARGAGSPFQWGDEAYVESRARRRVRPLVRGARLPPRRATTAARCGSSTASNYGPSFTLWTSLDDDRRPSSTTAMEASSRATGPATGSTWSAATSSSPACARDGVGLLEQPVAAAPDVHDVRQLRAGSAELVAEPRGVRVDRARDEPAP